MMQNIQNRRFKKLKFIITCVFLGVLISVAMVEICLMLIGFNKPIFHKIDRELGIAHRPNVSGWQNAEGESFVSINRHGFHDRNRNIKKSSGVVRVAVLGDSYAEAMQVDGDQNFSSVSERLLNDSSNFNFEVLNFGVSGYGTTQELLLLKQKVIHYSPDIVVLAFLTGNDIRNNSKELEGSPRPFFIKKGSEYVLDESFRESDYFAKRSSFVARALVGMADYSRLVQLLNKVRTNLRTRAKVQTHSGSQASSKVELGLDSEIYRAPTSPEWIEAWQVTEYLFKEFAKEVESQGAQFLLVTLSNGIQVDPRVEERRRMLDALEVDDLFYPDRRVEQFCNENDIPVLVLAPLLRQMAEKEMISLHGFQNTGPFKGHWNQNGHRLAGELISKRILELLGNSVGLTGSQLVD